MKKLFLTGLLLMCCAAAVCGRQGDGKPGSGVSVFTLSNGMEVWLCEDHTMPVVFGGVAVRAGARDCPDTGIAHYFEHMMFKGTDRIGTLDYEKEKPLLDRIEAQYAELKTTTDPIRRREIQSRINELTVESARWVVPNEFSQLITAFGGSMLNASTSYDHTVYFNIFPAHNLAPWLELNSERLLAPVFRLFQSELETVYEEKNMYGDNFAAAAMERALERVFEPHPYSRPILGSSENLKNPDMAAMREFYRTYYVAGNMGLLLSGDFETERVLPLIEKYFSRIPAGVPQRPAVEMPREFSGLRTAQIKLPIPLVRAGAAVWRTVPMYDPDEAALGIAAALLSNSNGTGYLDRLTKERKVMMAGGGNMAMNEAGVMLLVYIPRMLFAGLHGAREQVMEAVEKIRSGQFTDSEFESAKLEYLKERRKESESIYDRALVMMQLYTGGRRWDDYLEEQRRTASLTREDIVRVAGKYLGDDLLVLEKKTGSYPKDRLEKPGFEPARPQTAVTRSQYGSELTARHAAIAAPRFIDVSGDLQSGELSGGRIYAVENPYNDIFRLEMKYEVGYNTIPMLRYLPDYLEYAGTDTLSNVDFQQKLRSLGSSISYNAGSDSFSIVLEGFDDRFDESYALLREFVAGVVPEPRGLKSVLRLASMEDRMVKKDPGSMSGAQLQYLLYGENSAQLRKPTPGDIKKYPRDGFIRDLREVCSHEVSVFYSGTRPLDSVAATVEWGLVEEGAAKKGDKAFYPLRTHDSAVWLLNMPDSRQSIINACIPMGDMTGERDRALASLFNACMGGSMNSLLFQEMREYRSYAYNISSSVKLPKRYEKETDGYFLVTTSTQIDKTIEAVSTLDSLLKGLDFTPERLESARRQVINDISNSFPDFRSMARVVDDFTKEGYGEDPKRTMFDLVAGFTLDDLRSFCLEHIAGRPVVWSVTTDTKKAGATGFEGFGPVTTLKQKLIMN